MKRLKNIHPGEVLLKDFLIPMKTSESELAKSIGMSRRSISEILKGKRRMTEKTALSLSEYFGNSKEFWLGIQANYDSEEKKRS